MHDILEPSISTLKVQTIVVWNYQEIFAQWVSWYDIQGATID